MIEQAFGAWLINGHLGAQLHAIPLALGRMQGAKIPDTAFSEFSRQFPGWKTFLESIGLLED